MKNALTILHTEASCGWGGQEIRILSEMAGMNARGHRTILLCPAHAPIYHAAQARKLEAYAVAIEKKNLRALLALRRWLQNNRVDVINTHSSSDSWLVALACQTLSRTPPIVRTRHVSAAINRKPTTRWLYQQATRFIVTTGEKLRETLVHQNGYAEQRIASVPTGIDTQHFIPGNQALARAQLNLAQEIRIIGIVATLRSWKGHDYLLEAFKSLPEDTHLLIVGDGPRRAFLEELVARWRLSQRVHLVGNQENVAPWLQAMDLFVLPSYANEGVPQSLMQAMASRLPVISTSVGSISEIVKHGETGLIVAPKDSQALASAMRQLLDDRGLASRLANNAHQYALSHFSLEIMLEKMERIFYQVGNQKLSPPGRILHINVSRIGDTLLATPVIRALASHYAAAQITALGHPKRVELLEHLPFIQQVNSITKNSARWKGWFGGKRWDLAVVHGFDVALIRYALRVSKHVVAFRQIDESLNRLLYSCIQRPVLDSLPAVDIQLALLQELGIEARGRYLSYQVSDAERLSAQARLRAECASQRHPLVGMVIKSFPTKPYRDWPLSHFIETAQRILARAPDAHFVLLGGSLAAEKIAQIQSALAPRLSVFAGKLTLRESGAIISLLDLYIGVDTGPTHLAGALGIPMLGLYHCMHRGRWLAPREHERLVVIEHPASEAECSAQRSMAEISVESVMPHIDSLLKAQVG